MQAELTSLRAQLDALKRLRGRGQGSVRPARDEGCEARRRARRSESGGRRPVFPAQGSAEGFDEELKDTKPTTLLAVFASGIVVGRLLAK